jgi:hypothetical protein
VVIRNRNLKKTNNTTDTIVIKKMEVSNLVHTTRFWNNPHQVRSRPKHLKAKDLIGLISTFIPNMVQKTYLVDLLWAYHVVIHYAGKTSTLIFVDQK